MFIHYIYPYPDSQH